MTLELQLRKVEFILYLQAWCTSQAAHLALLLPQYSFRPNRPSFSLTHISGTGEKICRLHRPIPEFTSKNYRAAHTALPPHPRPSPCLSATPIPSRRIRQTGERRWRYSALRTTSANLAAFTPVA